MDSSAIEYPQVKREEVEETFFGKVVMLNKFYRT
jgi:hypothetical protein